MEALKILVIVVIIFGVGILGDETNREGKWNKKGMKGGHRFHKPNDVRKPYPLVHQAGHKFNGKKDTSSKTAPIPSYISQAHPIGNSKNQFSKPTYPKVALVEDDDPVFNFYTDKLVADPQDIPSAHLIEPRLGISADDEVTYSRSMKLDSQQSFHDDSSDSSHSHQHKEHMDEDHDHFHKIRTLRSAPAPSGELGTPQLASTLGKLLQGTQTLQTTDVNQGAQAGDYLLLSASGDTINVSNQGTSAVSGSGTVSSSATTTVNTSNDNNGWKQ